MKHAFQAPGLLVAALLLLLSGPAGALDKAPVPDPVILLTPSQAASFASAFTELSRQAHVMVVAEDQPLHRTLSPLTAAGLKLNRNGEPLSALLPKLAAAYDYNAQLSGKAFLLKKRYTDAADLPSVTLKECALGMEEIVRYADQFDPHFPGGEIDDSPAMKDLIYSLTPTQDAASDTGAVAAATLTPERQEELAQFLRHFYVQRAVMQLPHVVEEMNRYAAADPRFSWQYFTPLPTKPRIFGYDALDHAMPFRGLLKSDMITLRQGDGPEMTQTAFLFERDPTIPAPRPANTPEPAPPVSSSLAQIITRLNTRSTDGLKVTVESYLAPKQATVFGEEAATPRQELNALADVYSLRVLTEEKEKGRDRLRLTRLTAQVPLTVLALHESILQALPDPLIRAYLVWGGANDLRCPPLMISAVKQIRTAAEPKIRTSKDGKVALSSLSEQEGRAFAILMTLDALNPLEQWLHPAPPEEFTRFNDLWIQTTLYEQGGKKMMGFSVMLPGANGSTHLRPGIGVGEIKYDPVNHTL